MWTKEPPKEPGWYWCFEKNELFAVQVAYVGNRQQRAAGRFFLAMRCPPRWGMQWKHIRTLHPSKSRLWFSERISVPKRPIAPPASESGDGSREEG